MKPDSYFVHWPAYIDHFIHTYLLIIHKWYAPHHAMPIIWFYLRVSLFIDINRRHDEEHIHLRYISLSSYLIYPWQIFMTLQIQISKKYCIVVRSRGATVRSPTHAANLQYMYSNANWIYCDWIFDHDTTRAILSRENFTRAATAAAKALTVSSHDAVILFL